MTKIEERENNALLIKNDPVKFSTRFPLSTNMLALAIDPRPVLVLSITYKAHDAVFGVHIWHAHHLLRLADCQN